MGLADSTYFHKYSAKDIKAMLYFRARTAEQEKNNAKNTAETKGNSVHNKHTTAILRMVTAKLVEWKTRLTAGMRRVFIWRNI